MDQKKQAVDSIARTLSVSLVEVIPHASFPLLTCSLDSELEMLRGGGKVRTGPVDPTELEDEDPLETFSRENIRPAALAMFPNDIRKLKTITARLRNLAEKYYLCGKFVNVLFLDEILEESDKIIAEFNDQIQSMYDRWNEEAKRFSDLSWDWLRSLSNLPQEKRRKFHLKIQEQLPSKETFRKTCRLSLELRPVPAPVQVENFSDKINGLLDSGWQNQMLELGQAAVVNCLQSAFDAANSILRTSLKGCEPAPKQRNKIASLSGSLVKNNLFSNELISKIAETFKRVASANTCGEELEEEMSMVLVDIWNYKNLSGDNINTSKCVLSEEELRSLDEMHKTQERIAGV